MSKIKLDANASGTGVFTIASPNSDTDRTLTLPDKAGTVHVGSAIDDNADAVAITIDSSERVGVNTTSPLVPLHVAGSTSDADGALGSQSPLFSIQGGNANNQLEFGMDNSGATAIGFIQSRNLAAGAQTISLNPKGGNVGIGTTTVDSYNQFKVQTSGTSAGAIIEATGTNGYAATSWKTDGGYWQIGLRHDNVGDLVFRNATSGIIAATIDTNGVASFGASGTKVHMYSDSTYSGIYNGSSLTSDESIYMGAGNEYHYLDGALSFQITGTHTYAHNVFPRADNTYDLGGTSSRWDDVYATNSSIQTSDEREKQDVEELTEAETRVAVAAKALLRKYRWKDAVEAKDNNPDSDEEARIHFGIVAQDLKEAFEAEGLDAGRYGMFIHSTWIDEENGEERDRMGIRYSELLAFIIAAI